MKKYIMTLLFAVAALAGYAQSEGSLSLGFEAGVPVGTSSDSYSSAFGGSLKLETPLTTSSAFTVSFGYTSLSAKATLNGLNVKPPAAVYMPIKLGVKYNIAGPLYIEGQAGAAIEIRGRRTTRFVYSPGLGFDFGRIDLGIRYEGWAGTGGPIQQIALRLAYNL